MATRNPKVNHRLGVQNLENNWINHQAQLVIGDRWIAINSMSREKVDRKFDPESEISRIEGNFGIQKALKVVGIQIYTDIALPSISLWVSLFVVPLRLGEEYTRPIWLKTNSSDEKPQSFCSDHPPKNRLLEN